MTDVKAVQVGRLAFREVKKEDLLFWVAYYAMPDTMVGAIELASVQMKFVAENEVLKQKFVEIVKTAAMTLLEDISGAKVVWGRSAKRTRERKRSTMQALLKEVYRWDSVNGQRGVSDANLQTGSDVGRGCDSTR